MRPTKYNHPIAHYATKWCTTSTTVRRYAARGCDWDASDYTVGAWLLKYAHKKPKAMRKAIYAVPGIDDPHAPKPKEPFNPAAFGSGLEALLARQDALEQRVAKLKPGDIEEALELQRAVHELDAEFDRLESTIPRA